MNQPPAPELLDVTVRDGSYLINHQYTPELVANIAQGLQAAGIQYAEVSHGLGIGAKIMGFPARVDDEALMEASKKAAPNLKLSAFISPQDYSVPVIPGLVEFFDIGRIGLNVDNVRSGDKIINKLHKYNKKVSVQLVRTHARPPDFVANTVKSMGDLGVDIFYVVDSFGSMLPRDVKTYVSAVKSNTTAQVGFHGHNNVSMAVSNTLAAWEAGATWLDASLMGVGRAAGNANLEALVHIFQLKGLLGHIDVAKLCETSREHVAPTFIHPPLIRYTDILLSAERMDFSPQELLPVLANILHMPLEEFLMTLHNTLKDDVTLDYAHIRRVFEKEGQNLDQILGSLGPQKN